MIGLTISVGGRRWSLTSGEMITTIHRVRNCYGRSYRISARPLAVGVDLLHDHSLCVNPGNFLFYFFPGLVNLNKHLQRKIKNVHLESQEPINELQEGEHIRGWLSDGADTISGGGSTGRRAPRRWGIYSYCAKQLGFFIRRICYSTNSSRQRDQLHGVPRSSSSTRGEKLQAYKYGRPDGQHGHVLWSIANRTTSYMPDLPEKEAFSHIMF